MVAAKSVMGSKVASKVDVHEWFVRLEQVSGAINFASRDLGKTVDVLMERLRPTLSADAIAVWSVETGTEFLKIDAHSGLSPQYVRFFNQSDRIRLGFGLVGKTMVERKAKKMEKGDHSDVLEQQRWRDMLADEGVVGILSAPMFIESRIVGALCLYYRASHVFTEEEKLFLQVLANQLAVTIENIRSYDVISGDRANLERQLQKLFNLQRITELLDLSFATSIDSSLKALLEYLQESFHSDSLAIFQPNSVGGLSLTVEAGLPSLLHEFFSKYPVTSDDHLIGHGFSAGEDVTSARAMTDERVDRKLATALALTGFMSLGVFPLVTKGRSMGVLVIFYRDIHEFSKDEMSILNLLSQFIGVSFENARTLESLVVEKARTRAMVDSLEDGVIVYASSGEIIECNPAIESLVRLPREKIIGKNFSSEPVVDTVVSSLRLLSTMFLTENEPKEAIVSVGENEVTIRITQVPFHLQELNELGYMRVAHDITKEKAVESLKSNFVTTASHQMRTPLTAIKWSIDTLADGGDALNEKQKKALDIARERVSFMAHLISDLLEESEMDESNKQFAFEKIDIREILGQVVSDLRVIADQKHIELLVEMSDNLPLATIDRKKFDLAIRNLVDNAIKYTQTGSVTIKAYVVNDVLQIAIIDTGIGVPHGDLKFLFNRFFRSGNAVRLVTDGSGLGLYLAKSIIERHNGTISISSEENKGSTFIVALPLKESMLPEVRNSST